MIKLNNVVEAKVLFGFALRFKVCIFLNFGFSSIIFVKVFLCKSIKSC